MIYPADNPSVAVLSGHGVRLRIEKGASEAPGTLRILTDDPGFAGGARSLVAPNGTKVEVDELNPPVVTPATEHAFVVRRLADQAPWVIGRAGMEYRDLIPTRLGGAMIASHIRVPDGPVPDMVHYHKVGFQLIFCVAGWMSCTKIKVAFAASMPETASSSRPASATRSCTRKACRWSRSASRPSM
jgi:hypothetical protein